MIIPVHFYSYFKELTGCAETTVALADGSSINELVAQLASRFPKLGTMQKSMLIAVGVDYAAREQVLKAGDEVSLFPPVQGG